MNCYLSTLFSRNLSNSVENHVLISLRAHSKTDLCAMAQSL